jgi:AraC family transcriptional regulator
MYEVTIRDLPRTRLVALRHRGPYDKIGGAFQRLVDWAEPRGILRPGANCIGIFYDDPETVAADQLRSDACLPLPAGAFVDGPMHERTIGPARCAIARHKGPYSELPRAYGWLFRTWMPASGFVWDKEPCFEEYLNDPMTVPPTDWLTDIHIPLRRA